MTDHAKLAAAVAAITPAGFTAHLVMPAGTTLLNLKCSVCSRHAATVILPPIPESPVEIRSLARPLVAWFARKTPVVRVVIDHALRGDLRAAVDAITSQLDGAQLVPVLCPSCSGQSPVDC